ncbi:hypothetical protein N4R57_07275 [Rhodobacteraceae bacterium D3-12]|nr:hypothetical protein N4R57_07275 [Rhodobacteraceae bacterium D3-12]
MEDFNAFDWSGASEFEQRRQIRKAGAAELNAVMRHYDWAHHPQTVIGWAAAQKEVELGAALAAFFNGDPMRFNYVPKRDVSDDYAATMRLLDTIFQRINAGFYLPDPVFCEEKLAMLERWMTYQREDARSRTCCGRWVFDTEMLEPVLGPQVIGFDLSPRESGDEAGSGFSVMKLLKPLVG